jgi:taurine dioxygenase
LKAPCRIWQASARQYQLADAMLRIEPLSRAIGVEIMGVDLSRPLDDDTFACIKSAWEQNCIALFRGQSLDEDAQTRFARRFGTLGGAINDFDPAKRGINPTILYVSNIRVDGKLTGVLPDGEMYFHTDQCYLERPAMASMLYAIEIPSRGGNTRYTNCFKAYAALPDDMKHLLKGKRALNAYDYDNAPTLRASVLPDGVKRFVHPIVRTHPATRRKSLYVNRLMTWSILDLAPDQSRALLEYLFDHQERPEFVYEHKWTPGDVILWDNRSCLHARTDFDPKERRRLRRVTINGDVPYE